MPSLRGQRVSDDVFLHLVGFWANGMGGQTGLGPGHLNSDAVNGVIVDTHGWTGHAPSRDTDYVIPLPLVVPPGLGGLYRIDASLALQVENLMPPASDHDTVKTRVVLESDDPLIADAWWFDSLVDLDRASTVPIQSDSVGLGQVAINGLLAELREGFTLDFIAQVYDSDFIGADARVWLNWLTLQRLRR